MNTKLSNRIVYLLWFLGSLAILSAAYRIFVTLSSLSSGILPSDPDDAHYVHNAGLALLHVIPGLLFLLLGPIQFSARVRARWPAWHRWSGYVLVLSGITAGISAIVINMVFPPVGGLFKSLAVYLFGIAQVVTLIVAVKYILARNIARHRAWMIRAFAIGLSVSTMRAFFIPVIFLWGIPSDFTIGLGMWVGFLVNIFASEYILWREQRKAQ